MPVLSARAVSALQTRSHKKRRSHKTASPLLRLLHFLRPSLSRSHPRPSRLPYSVAQEITRPGENAAAPSALRPFIR